MKNGKRVSCLFWPIRVMQKGFSRSKNTQYSGLHTIQFANPSEYCYRMCGKPRFLPPFKSSSQRERDIRTTLKAAFSLRSLKIAPFSSSSGGKPANFELRKKSGFESCSNISFPLMRIKSAVQEHGSSYLITFCPFKLIKERGHFSNYLLHSVLFKN